MSKHYPYLSDKKKVKNIVCETCHKTADGYNLEWQVDWFRGDDEFEKICMDCFAKRMAEEKEEEKKRYAREQIIAEKQYQSQERIKKQLESKYTVRYLTEYQWRINGTIDIFPTNKRYHNIKENRRGDYRDIFSFLALVLKP